MNTTCSDSVLRHCIYESEQWRRLLVFFKQENGFCKLRLAEVVTAVEEDGSLAEAEAFYDQFLSQDNMIDFLSNELKKHCKLFEKKIHLDGESLKVIIKNQSILGRNIQNAGHIFFRTRKSFSVYLLSLL